MKKIVFILTVMSILIYSYTNLDILNNINGIDAFESNGIENNFKASTRDVLLVNKDNSLDETYQPTKLVKSNHSLDKLVYLEEIAAKSLDKMFKDAKNEGHNFLLISGYRSYEYQNKVYVNSLQKNGQSHTDKYVARPGQSEHQTGLALDIGTLQNTSLDISFEDTAEAKWLHENMYDYGFILRYPKDKEDITGYNYEPWHIRYVGVDIAKEIQETEQTLEEYLNCYKS